jgi:hypothetical protein
MTLQTLTKEGLIVQNKNDMQENRKNRRYQTLARVRIPGVLEGETLLKDLSVTGCCVECTAQSDIKPDTQYRLEIFPEGVSKIGNFDLFVESKWIRSGSYSSEVGFNIIASPRGKLFQRYVDYLDWRHSAK